jgi:hypothetical protein
VGSCRRRRRPVELRDDALDVLGGQPLLEGDDLHVGVEGVDGLLGRFGLGLADQVGRVDDLPLEVREIDHVHVDDAEGAHAGRGQVECGRRTQAARAHEQHLGVEELLLPGLADLGDDQVAPVALLLLGAQRAASRPSARRRASGCSRRRGWRRWCSPALAALRRERGARPAGAVDHHRRGAVGDLVLDAQLQEAAGHGERAGQLAGRDFVGLAHVDEHRRCGGLELAGHLLDGHLADLLLRLADELFPAGHGIPPH